MTFTPDERDYLDTRFGEIISRLKVVEAQGAETAAVVREHVTATALTQGRIFGELETHELVLRGEDGRDGLVGDVQDLRSEAGFAKGTLVYFVVPTLVIIVGALLISLVHGGL